MSAARIAARLRERLPEADGWGVTTREGDLIDVRVYHVSGVVTGCIDSVFRRWGRPGDEWSPRDGFRGRGWPLALADALADALLGTP